MIKIIGGEYTKINFPAGEPHIKVNTYQRSFVDIRFVFEESYEIVDLLY